MLSHTWLQLVVCWWVSPISWTCSKSCLVNSSSILACHLSFVCFYSFLNFTRFYVSLLLIRHFNACLLLQAYLGDHLLMAPHAPGPSAWGWVGPGGEILRWPWTKDPGEGRSLVQLSCILFGYGSIPINTIFMGMNIHLPAILMFTRGTRFWHTAICLFIMIMIMMIVCVMIIITIFLMGTVTIWLFFIHVISRPKRLFIVGTGQSFLNEPNMNSFLRKSSFAGHWYIGQQCW